MPVKVRRWLLPKVGMQGPELSFWALWSLSHLSWPGCSAELMGGPYKLQPCCPHWAPLWL